jgi:hypothetical protein
MYDSFDFLFLDKENIITDRPIYKATLLIEWLTIKGPFARAKVPNFEFLSSR